MATRGERPLVLVIEDEARHRAMYGDLLWYNGFEVAYAGDGEEGLRLALELRPDLIVLDLILPKIPGIDVARRLKQDPSTAGIPVVALSGRPRADLEPEILEAGCAHFLEKPVSPVHVLHIVESLVGRPPAPGAIEPQSI